MLEQETMKTRQMGPSGCNIDGCLNYLYRPQKRGKNREQQSAVLKCSHKSQFPPANFARISENLLVLGLLEVNELV